MHRSYQTILPTHNKLLQQKWDKTYYEEHRRMVRDAVPVVDSKAPQTYMHLHLKLKKLQLEEERLATIERDNRILLEKMSYIMRTRGRIDNRNNYEYKSLNREKRQRELLRVTKENISILQRITNKKPEYDHMIWQEDWEKNLKFMDSISAYPRDWWKETPQSARSSARSEKRKSSSDSKNREEKVEEEEEQKDDKPEDTEQSEEQSEQKQDEDEEQSEQKELETA